MKTASVATLKQNLSEYLHFVEQGDEVLVTSHRRHIARLVPEHSSGLAIRPPSLPLSALNKIGGVKLMKPFSTEQILLADRGRR